MTEAIGRWEIAARVASGFPRIVVAVVAGAEDVATFVRELCADLKELSGAEVSEVSAHGADDIEAAIEARTQVVIRVDGVPDEQWRALDRARSRLTPKAPVVLVADNLTAKRISAAAPALSSWVAGSMYLSDGLEARGQAAALERLAGLRERFRMTDEEAVQKAVRGEGPTDPEFAVWLVVLGRGDLVEGARR